MLDPFHAVAELIIGWRKTGEAARWFRLLFSMSASYWLSFSTVTGTSLMGNLSIAHALGAGMVAGAAMAFVAYLRADKDLTKGTVIAVPQKTVDDQFQDGGNRGPSITKPS